MGKKDEMYNQHFDFLQYYPRDWFLFYLILGALTGKVAAPLNAWGSVENKGKPSPKACYSTRDCNTPDIHQGSS